MADDRVGQDSGEPNVFLNTQIQSNLDLWEAREKNEKALMDLRKYSKNSDDDHVDLPLTLMSSKAPKKPKNPAKKRKTKTGVVSITGQMSRKHAKKSHNESILKLLSGKKRKVNEILDKIESLETRGVSNSESDDDVPDETIVYSKDEWFNLLKIIRVNFPSLSKKAKLSLSKINKVYEEQYDSQYQATSQETPTLWGMASSLPKTRLIPEDLRWLYDVETNDTALASAQSSVSELDEHTMLTLSQLVNDRKKELDSQNNIIDLTQQSEEHSVIDVDTGLMGTPPQENIIEIPSSSPRASPIKVSPTKLLNLKNRAAFTDKLINASDNKSASNETSKIEIKASVSFSEKALQRAKSLVESIRSSGSFVKTNHNSELPSPIKDFINRDDIDVHSIHDSYGEEGDEIVNIVDGEYQISRNTYDTLDKKQKSTQILDSILEDDEFNPHQGYGKLSTQDMEEFLYLSNGNQPDNEDPTSKYMTAMDSPVHKETLIENEINQLEHIPLEGTLDSHFKRDELKLQFQDSVDTSSNINCKSSVYSTARSQIKPNNGQKQYHTVLYEFKGRIDELKSPYKKSDATVSYKNRQREPDEIPDSQSEDENEISIIEIRREVYNKVDPENDDLASQDVGDISELQVPSSPDAADLSEEKSTETSKYKTVFDNMSLVILRLLSQKWSLKTKRSKQEMSSHLWNVYKILLGADCSFAIQLEDIGDYSANPDLSKKEIKIKTEEAKQKQSAEFYEKLTELSPQDVRVTLFNYISRLVMKDSGLYDKILTFEPISLNEVKLILESHETNLDMQIIKDWCDENSVTQSAALGSEDDENANLDNNDSDINSSTIGTKKKKSGLGNRKRKR